MTAKRMVMSPLNGDSSKAALYLDTFTKLKKDFLTESAVVTEITVFQILTKTDELLANIQYLNGLPYAKNQVEPEECHPGTRGAVITEIMRWFAQPLSDTAERVFWLYGVAGCGKSTIAQTVARQLRAQKRCVSFFFDTSRQADAGLKHLFATISRDLADLNNDWKASLIKTIEGSAKAKNSSTVKSQFENLIVEPAEDLDGIGPVLIIIDALDESGSREERETLLKALAQITKLPRYFRFLITSRPEPDIVNALGDHAWVRPSRLDRVDEASTKQDIRRSGLKKSPLVPISSSSGLSLFANISAVMA